MTQARTATFTDYVGDHEIVATAEKTGDRARDGYGWWIGRYSIRREGAPRAEGRVPGHYISAEGALDAAVAEARRSVGSGGPGPSPPAASEGRGFAT